MDILKFRVRGQALTLTNPNVNLISVTDTVNQYLCQFEFNEDWDDLNKVVVFKNVSYNITKEVYLSTSNECYIPWEVLSNSGDIFLEVIGTESRGEVVTVRIPSTLLGFKWQIQEGLLDVSANISPTPDLFEQFVNQVREYSTSAIAARDEALIAKDAVVQSVASASASELAASSYAESAENSASTASSAASSASEAALSVAGIADETRSYAEIASTKAAEAATEAELAAGAKEGAVMAKNDAEAARDAAVVAKNDAETARDAAVVAKNDAETARDATLSAKETFDNNAETKLTAYNQNALEKTASYNTNATEKLNAYNVNADNRVAEFNAQTGQIQADVSELKSDLSGLQTIVDSKADKSELAKTNLYLDTLYKLNKGQTYDVLEQESEAYSVDVPSGSHYVGVDTIGGNTVVWNQLVKQRESSLTANGVTSTYNTDGTVTLSGTVTSSYAETYSPIDLAANHVYFYSNVILANPNNISFLLQPLNLSVVRPVVKNTSNSSRTNYGISGVTSGTDLTGIKFKSNFFDLTQMFGSTIADYIYSLEQSQAGAGVAWFKKLFPNDYYEYCEPTIISSQTDRVDVRGKNLLPVQTSFNNRISLFFPSGTKLFASCKDDGIGAERVAYFRQDKTLIDYWGLNDLGNGRKGRAFTAEEDIYYIAIFSNNGSQYIMTDQQLEYGTTATDYSPYSLQQITTGFPVLNSAGSVYDYIDLNEGKLHQRVGVVDLGSLSWVYDAETQYVHFLAGKSSRFSPKYKGGLICPIYTWNPNGSYSTIVNMEMCIDNSQGNPILRIKNDSYTDAATFKAAMSGVMLVYELAEEVITDITIPTELSDWLMVEAGGSVTFHNTDEGKRLLIPNKLSFIRKLDEVTV